MLADGLPDETLPARTSVEHGYARTQRAFARAQRHSRVISVLKIVVPVAAIGIAAAFFVASYVLTPADINVDSEGSAIVDGKLVMANPKMEGLTKEKRPYSMSAARAIQNLATPDVIQLENISAKLPVDLDNWASIEAPAGTYNRTANTLDFKSPFTVETTDGMSVAFKSAFLDIGKGAINTVDPVDITLQGTRIQADSMSLRDQGKTMVFERRVRVNMQPKSMNLMQEGNGG